MLQPYVDDVTDHVPGTNGASGAGRPVTRSPLVRLLALAAVLGTLALYAALVYVKGWKFGVQDLRIYLNATDNAIDGGSPYAAERGYGPFIYPPISLFLFAPLTLVSLKVASVVAAVGSVLAGLCLVAALHSRFEPLRSDPWSLVAAVAVFFVSAPVWVTLLYGQINLLVAALVVVDLLWLARRPRFSGVGIGIAAGLKLTPAIFVALLLLGRQTRSAVTAGVTFALTTLLLLPFMGDTVSEFWTERATELPEFVGFDHDTLFNQSLYAYALRASLPQPELLANAVGIGIAALALLAAVRVYNRGDVLVAIVICGAASSVLTPIAWVHHSLWLPVAAVVLLLHWSTSGRLAFLAGAVALTAGTVTNIWVLESFDAPVLGALAHERFLLTNLVVVAAFSLIPARAWRADRAESAGVGVVPRVAASRAG